MTELLDRLGVEHPIILSPMAAGPGTPELAAAVANAGGLGSLPGGYVPPDDIRRAIRRFRELATGKAVNVNLFAGGHHDRIDVDPAAILRIMERVHKNLGIDPPQIPTPDVDQFEQALEVVLEMKPEVFSFTFGVPARRTLDRIRGAGIITFGTATTQREARILADSGVDAIVAQGAEAGGHRGTFDGAFEDALVSTLDLTEQIARSVSVPVIAAGGIMDGRDIKAALNRGAVAVQMGTAFLACPEAGTPQAEKALLAKGSARTVLTRAFSGRMARVIHNEFVDLVGDTALLPYPIQASLARPMRAAAAARGETRFLAMLAGSGIARARVMPAGELVATLVSEMV
jgi:nitronate monooxygenase